MTMTSEEFDFEVNKEVRQMIFHENGLKDQRFRWFLTSQGFLIILTTFLAKDKIEPPVVFVTILSTIFCFLTVRNIQFAINGTRFQTLFWEAHDHTSFFFDKIVEIRKDFAAFANNEEISRSSKIIDEVFDEMDWTDQELDNISKINRDIARSKFARILDRLILEKESFTRKKSKTFSKFTDSKYPEVIGLDHHLFPNKNLLYLTIMLIIRYDKMRQSQGADGLKHLNILKHGEVALSMCYCLIGFWIVFSAYVLYLTFVM